MAIHTYTRQFTADHLVVNQTIGIRQKPWKRQPRNQPCQCDSGKKAKKCCVYVMERNKNNG